MSPGVGKTAPNCRQGTVSARGNRFHRRVRKTTVARSCCGGSEVEPLHQVGIAGKDIGARVVAGHAPTAVFSQAAGQGGVGENLAERTGESVQNGRCVDCRRWALTQTLCPTAYVDAGTVLQIQGTGVAPASVVQDTDAAEDRLDRWRVEILVLRGEWVDGRRLDQAAPMVELVGKNTEP